ncbi:MAG TPA: nuclear transport factor 2 family protein [Sphingomicrobium sp.]|nr:nuclear transport factor 2 family protein [Sphingomicrobium sp.]
MRILCLALIAMGVPAAAAPATRATWVQRTLASAAPFIDKANADWSRAIVAGNARVLSEAYAKNAVFVGPDGTAIRGKAGIRTMYARRPSTVHVLNASIRSDGRTAPDAYNVYEWGTAKLTVKRGKRIIQRSARYLTVWHHAGARWVITRNIAF